MTEHYEFISLMIFHLQKYHFFNYDSLSEDEQVLWPKWLGIDNCFCTEKFNKYNSSYVLPTDIFVDYNNTLHCLKKITFNKNFSYIQVNDVIVSLYMKYMNYFNTMTKRKKFLRLQDTVCDIPEINEYSNCLYSYHSFFKRIGDFYNLCLSLKKTSNDKTIYEIYSSFNKQYKVLLIIKEYFKMTNYRKEYDKIKKCKNAIKILTLQKVIYKHIYNAIVNNNYNIYSNYMEKNNYFLNVNEENTYYSFSNWYNFVFNYFFVYLY